MGFQKNNYTMGEMGDIVGQESRVIRNSIFNSESFFLNHLYFFLLLLVLLTVSPTMGQTPGLILKPIAGGGSTVLDPNGDGYVSEPTWGVQLGFQNDDVTESEIKYVPMVRPDPEGDLSSGATGGFTDIVGTNLDGNNAVLTYLKDGNIYFRIRVSAYAANSKAYSVLADTDDKFGFTGPNADPNAKPGNPGFEIEIVLKTNFAVDVYDVDNKVNGIPLVPENTYTYESYCQKSVALSTNSGNPDYFYDFYVPIPSAIANSAGVRYVVVTSMSPSAVIGRTNLSDVGGVGGTAGSLDQLFAGLVNSQTPTVPGQAVLTRSDCPTINPVTTTATAITGTTTEAAGTTITVSVYDNNGLLKGSGVVITTSSGWSVNVSALTPSVTLTSGYTVKATATAPGEGESNDNCDIKTISDAPCSTAPPTAISFSNSGKIDVSFSSLTGTKTVTVYNSNGTVWKAITTTLTTQVQLTDGIPVTGNKKVPDGTYYATITYNGCESTKLYACFGTTTISAPSIDTPVPGALTVTGSGVSGGFITVYVDDKQVATTTITGTGTTWSVAVPALAACQKVTATQSKVSAVNSDNGGCISGISTPVYVTRQALAPIIVNNIGCASSPPTSISGYSSEIGATIELYKSTNTTTPIGTTIVPSSGIWTVSSISPALVSGNIIQAKVATGGCLTSSNFSNQVTISTQTNISGYTITINTPTEGQTKVTGTVTGGAYPVTLKVYVDQALVGSGINISSPGGSWEVSGLKLFDLAVGSKVQVTLTSNSGCESALSTASATVQCLAPAERTITAGNSTVCANSNATIVVQLSEAGVLYTPVASDGTTVFGYGRVGDGGNLTLTTYPLTTHPTVLKVRASKFPLGSCDVVINGSVSFNLTPSPAAPTAGSPQVYCATGTPPTIADLLVTLPENCSVRWYTMATGGYPLASTTQVVANTTYYAESVNNTTGCRSNTRAAVLVQAGTPTAPTATANQTFCAGATIANLTASLSGPGTIRWYATPTLGSPLAAGTLLVTGNTYYAETLQNSCVSSSRTMVNVTVNPIPTITATTPAAICGPGAVTLGATASAGTVNWYDAATSGNLVGTGTSFTTSPISSTTTYYVDATLNGCTTATRTAVVATVNAIPTITITAAPTCTPDLLAYSVGVTVSGGTVTSTAGTVVNTSGNVWTISNVTKGTNITLTVNHNGCTRTLSVTAPDCGCEVVATPVSGGDKQYCSGSAISSISATVGSGVTIDWYAAPSGGSPILSNAFSYTPSAAGTYYAEARNISTGCKSSMRTAITVTENPAPVINSMTTSACSGVGFTVTPTNGINGTVPSGTTYSWSAPSGTGFTGGQAGSGAAHISGILVNTTSVAQTATYTVTPVAGSCTGAAFTVTVTINPTATITSVTGTTPLAMGATATYTANSVVLSGGTGAWSSSNTAVATVNASSGLVTAITPGTSNITYTISGGCGGTVSAATTVTVVPTVNLTPATLTSIGESGTLTFTVQLSAASSQPVTLPFSLGGTATNGTDYIITASPVTIPAGSTNATITITISNDMVVEGDETVIVTLGSPTHAVLGDVSIFTATITDNDFNPADDADGDGIVNTVDADDDNDGIADSVEGSTDTDGDGKANWFDLDSDNDGIYDLLEAGGTDTDFDGKVDNFVDGNGNGITDVYDTNCNRSVINGSGSQVVSFLYVSNENAAVDNNTGTFAALYNATAYINISLQHTVPIGTTISILLSCDGNNTTTTGTIEQSLNNSDYSNSQTFSRYGRTGVIFDYTVTGSDARYIRIKRTNDESIRVYNLNYSFTICNGTQGTAISDHNSDGDSNADRIDIDSDNDGCKDVIEAGFTDTNSDGKLDGTGVSSLGAVIGNINGYTAPDNIYLTSALDFREANPAAVGGSVSGSATICSGSGSGTLTLSGHNGAVTKWQSSVYPFTAWSDIPVTSTTYSAAVLTETTHFRAVVVTSACSSATSTPAIVTVLPTPTATISGTTSVCQDGAAPVITFTNPQALPVTITYTINGSNQTNVNVNASSSSIVTVPTTVAGVFNYNLVRVAYQGATACSNNISGTSTVTVVASVSVAAGTDMNVCYSSGGINVTSGSDAVNYAGIIWSASGTGTFSNATSLTLATYTPSLEDIAGGVVTLTITATGNSPCGSAASIKTLTITRSRTANFSYPGSPYCRDAANPFPTFSNGGVAGTFSSTTGLVFVSTATGEIDIAASTPGTYTVTNTIAAAGACGTVTATGTITITPVTSAPTANNIIVTYDGLSHSAAATVAPGETVDWYTAATGGSVTTAPTGTNVGVFSAYAEARNTTTGCLSASRTLVTLTVNAAPLSITANNVNKVYGTSLTGVSGSTAFATSGLKNGETIGTVTINYGTGSQANVAVGTYTGSVIPGAAVGGTFTASNYSITYHTALLSVVPAAITITANGPSKTYGTALTTGASGSNFTVTGSLASGESVTSVTLTPNAAGLSATTSAGLSYTVTPSLATGTGGFLAGNYTITYVPYNGIVATKALSITATSQSKTYGSVQATPVAGSTAFTSSGLANSETIGSVTLSYGAGALAANSPVNSTSVITPSGATGGTFTASNYTITYNTALLTVVPKALTITATSQSKTYGTTFNFVGTEFTTSGLVNSDAVTSVTLTSAGSIATATVPGSPYSIVPSAAIGSGLSNYSITYSNGTMTVTKAPLTVTANNQSKVYDGAVFSPFTVSYSGFVNSETSAVLGGTATYSGSAIAARNVLTGYVITPGGLTSDNYNISFMDGSLTITAATLTPIIAANNKCFDGSTLATLSSQTLAGVYAPDIVNLVVATSNFADASAGVDKTVTASGLSLSGASAGNYILSANTANATATIYALPTASVSGNANICKGSSANLSIHLTGNGPWDFTYTDGTTPVTITGHATNLYTINVSPVVTTTYTIIAVSDSHCTGTNFGSSATVVVTNLPTATLAYGTPFCSNEGVQPVELTGTGGYTGGTFTALPAGLTIDAATGAITPATSEVGIYTVTYTIAALGGCAVVTATTQVTINQDGSWTGAENENWNNLNNWACKRLPTLSTNVVIANGKPHYPLLTADVTGQAHDITIGSSAWVTVTGGTLQIAGAIYNSGTFTSTEGTIEMKGSAAQTIGADVFETNTLMDLSIDNPTAVTLTGTLNITGVVRPKQGDFNADGNLTLLSTSTQTALIDGSGSGNVLGNVNMQRYLPNSFGYKYFSSPFQGATVAEFAPEVKLDETFPTFYKYDEDHSRDSSEVTVYYTGWTKYTTPEAPLDPLYGYAANMGTGTDPVTVTMSGVVNNGNLHTTLFNHNRKYTKGFNLVGNPYPSPIDWDAPVGWTREGIDGAVYFFNAGNTDRYSGVYTSYVNGTSTGSGDNTIAAMQGFFVHVTDPAMISGYPVSATLGMSNSVRTNNLNPVFKSATIDSRPAMRLKAGFEIKNAMEDAAVVYFDPTAGNGFEKDKDALKMYNTDIQVPNIYTLSPDGRELSINGLSVDSDSISSIPVGVTTFMSGWINLRAENVKDLTLFEEILLKDALTGQLHDLRQSPDVRFYLDKGKYDRRFSLLFSKVPMDGGNTILEKLFTVVRSGNSLLVKVNLPSNTKGNLMVTNLLGQNLLRKEVFEKETVEISQGTGVYVITLVTGKMTMSEKILMRTDYE